MKKKAQVIMLPTDRVDEVVMKWRDGKIRNHHLYIVTDDGIKSGDWVLFGDVVMVATSFDDRVIYDEEGNSFMKYDCKKIIATTDSELSRNLQLHTYIPKPSKAFIEKYCNVGGIDEVEVEYQVFPYKTGDIVSKTYRLKVNSHNEITIHPIKDRWTREEVEERCREVFELGASAFQDCLNPHTLEFDHETFKRLKEEAVTQNK